MECFSFILCEDLFLLYLVGINLNSVKGVSVVRVFFKHKPCGFSMSLFQRMLLNRIDLGGVYQKYKVHVLVSLK